MKKPLLRGTTASTKSQWLLTLQAEQYMNHYAQKEQAFFHSTVRAMETHAEAVVARESSTLEPLYVVQTTEVEQRTRVAVQDVNTQQPSEEEGDLHDAVGTAEEEEAAEAEVPQPPAAAGVVPVGPPATPPVLSGQIPSASDAPLNSTYLSGLGH